MLLTFTTQPLFLWSFIWVWNDPDVVSFIESAPRMLGVFGNKVVKLITNTYLLVFAHHYSKRTWDSATCCTPPIQQTGSIQLFFHTPPVSVLGERQMQARSVLLAWTSVLFYRTVLFCLCRKRRIPEIGNWSSSWSSEPWQLGRSQIYSLTKGLQYAIVLYAARYRQQCFEKSSQPAQGLEAESLL